MQEGQGGNTMNKASLARANQSLKAWETRLTEAEHIDALCHHKQLHDIIRTYIIHCQVLVNEFRNIALDIEADSHGIPD